MWLLATQLSELKCVRIGQDSCCSSGAYGLHTAQMLVDWTLDLDSLRSWRHPHNPVNLDCARAVPLFKLVVQPLVVEKLWSQLELPFGQLLPFNARCMQSCSRISLKLLACSIESKPRGTLSVGVLFPFCCDSIGHLLAPV